MTQAVLPSITTIAAERLEKIQEQLATALRISNLPTEQVQQVLEVEGDALVAMFMAELRRRVEVTSNMIVRRVKVNRTRSPHSMLEATGRKQYVDDEVLSSMPHGEGEEVDVYFFKPGYRSHQINLDQEFDLRGLKQADSYSQAAVNEEDPAFANEYTNVTYWKDAGGNWCHTSFEICLGEKCVRVRRSQDQWDGGWWCVGLRK